MEFHAILGYNEETKEIDIFPLEEGGLRVVDPVANALVPKVFDYVSLSYTGKNLTGVVFKTGGSGGTTVSTLTLGYDATNKLTSVTKT